MRVRDFRLYFLGQIVSVSGNWMQMVALAMLVLEITSSGTWLGVVMASRYAPMLVLSMWGGVTADRVAKRTIVLVTQVLCGLLALALGLLVLFSSVTVVVVLVISALMGATNAFDNPARQAWISEIVSDELLHSAVRMTSVLINIARVIGPLLAAGIIAAGGLAWCFLSNAATYVVVVGCTLLMAGSRHTATERLPRRRGQIREGLRHVRSTPALAVPMLMVALTGALAWEFPVTLPLMAERVFDGDASVYAAMTAAMGVGAVLSGVIGAARPQPTHRSLLVSAIGWGLAICAAALSPSLIVMYVLLVLVGYGSVSFNANAKTILQTCAGPDMRGRVMALWSIAWLGSAGVGAPIVGVTAEVLGARFGLLIGGIAALICGLVALPWRHLTIPRQGATQTATS